MINIISTVDRAIKKVWLEMISKDYVTSHLLKEDSLKNAFYYHLRTELGNAVFEKHHLRIFTEFYLNGERIDLVVAQMNEFTGKRSHLKDDVVSILAAIEMKYKNGTQDGPFHDDVNKVLRFIQKHQNRTQYYLAFIQEATYLDQVEEFSWLTKRQQSRVQERLTEMTGIFVPSCLHPVWLVHSYNQLNLDLNRIVYPPEEEVGNNVV